MKSFRIRKNFYRGEEKLNVFGEMYLLKGHIMHHTQFYQEAETCFKKALEIYKNNLYPKVPQAMSIVNTLKIISYSLIGKISPYPTVIIVTHEK